MTEPSHEDEERAEQNKNEERRAVLHFTQSICSSANRPHTVKRPVLRLQGSYYHVINLFRINRAAKTQKKVKGQCSDSNSSMKGGLLNERSH